MTTITPTTYQQVAKLLLKAIDDRAFFNGTIEYDTEEFYSSFRATLIIYREKIEQQSVITEIITDIVPVWWEFSLHSERGDEMTDFSWRELAQYLI